MIRFVASRPVKLAVFGLSVAGASSAFACPRPGGGGYGGGYSRPVQYVQPHYHPAPHYPPPPHYHAAPQPYVQPSVPPQQTIPPQPRYAQGQPYQGQPVQGQQFPGQVPQGPSFPQSQPMQQGQVQQGQMPQGQMPQGQPIHQQQGTSQQFAGAPQGAPSQQQAPGQQQSAPPQSQNVAPQQNVPTQTAQAPATQAPPASADASMTALQILAGMSAPEAAPAQTTSIAPTQAATDPRVGRWIAKLGNGAVIRLDLRADGSFVWTATQEGKTNSFEGSYAFGSESLTLARSSDNQKLGGKLTVAANGFNFKLDGSSDSGLDFVRG
jgi:hypothetical protein